MLSSSKSEERTRAETFVFSLRSRLRSHALWDALAIFGAPFLALLCAAYFLVQATWLSLTSASALVILALGSAAFAVILWYRLRTPKLPQTAGLLDQRAGAKDHFLTLATIDPAHCPAPMLSRLHRDAEGLINGVELARDFPYKVKTPSYWSVGGSLLTILLLYFLSSPPAATLQPLPSAPQLRQLADKMAQVPQLKGLAEQLKSLAAKLEDEKVTAPERHAAVQELKEKIQQQQKKDPEQSRRDLLSKAADELNRAEQQQVASGKEQQDKQSQDGGDVQSNRPKEGQGEGKQSQSGSNANQGKMGAQPNNDMQQGKSAQGNPKEPNQDRNQSPQDDTKGNQPDPNQPGKESKKDLADKGQGGTKEGAGKNQASDEPPQSTPPAERFYRAGEGKEGIKGARYVAVQLPEDIAADAKGESKTVREGKGNRSRVQVPVSNMPLPAHVPSAPSEKQQMPIEYRGLIK